MLSSFHQELVEQMLLRLDLAVSASPTLRPTVRQLVPALLGPQVNNLRMLCFIFDNYCAHRSLSKVEEPGPDLVAFGGGQVNGEAAVCCLAHLHLPRDLGHGAEFLLPAGARLRPWGKALLPSQVRHFLNL